MRGLLADFLEGLGLYLPPHSRAAQAYARRAHRSWKVVGTRTLARERGRHVIAVFYEEPRVISRPVSYRLYGVSNDLARVQELPTGPDRPYWIHGRK